MLIIKVRKGFVTNSSSTSYTVIYEVNDCKELRDYLAEEYGKFGARIAEEYFVKDKEIAKREWYFEYIDKKDFNEEKTYLKADFELSSTEGNIECDDAFLANAIPDEYKKEIYNNIDSCY